MKEIAKRILVKITSTKFVITVWSATMISIIAINNITEMNNIALALCAVPVSYFVANTIQKK